MDLLLKAWTAYSFATTLVGAGGVALIVLALWLAPARLKIPVALTGLAILGMAVSYQSGRSNGVSETVDLATHQAQEAERIRGRLSREDEAEDRKMIEKELAQARADNAALKRINHALATDPERDRRCTTVDDARELRKLRAGTR